MSLLFFLCYNPNVIVDFHTHIFPPTVIRKREQYLAADAEFAALYSHPTARLVDAEELIDSMDTAEISMSIVCGFAWSSAALCQENNDYILSAISRYPHRLAGLVTVSTENASSALDELERCVRGGAIGLGEMRPSPDDLADTIDSPWTPLVNFIVKNNLLCLLHASEPAGHLYPGKGTLTPSKLYPFITRFPALKIVLAHWGGGLPFYNLMPKVRKALSNTWFDSAASPFLYDPSVYKHVSQLVNPERILFGSDYPLMPHSRALKDIDNLAISNTLKQSILGGNAMKLLGKVHAK